MQLNFQKKLKKNVLKALTDITELKTGGTAKVNGL